MLKIVIFDLDLTISTVHTRGRYKNYKKEWDINEYITDSKKKEIVNCLEKLKLCGIKIYLCSRGELNACYWFLRDSELLEYFDGVFGAFNLENYPPLDFLSDRYQLELSEAIKPINVEGWELEKVRIINKIIELQSVEKSSVFFYDDTLENIRAAHEDRITAYQVDPNKEQSLIELMKSNIECLKGDGESKEESGDKVREESGDKVREESGDKLREEFVDLTLEFSGSVGRVMEYFASNPEDQRKVKVYSKRVGKWYANTNPETGEHTYQTFYPHSELNREGPTDEIFDLTAEFEGSVGNAISFFTRHKNYKRRAKVYSVRVKKWYSNTNPETGEYTHEKFSEHPEFNKKYLINDICYHKYNKYKKKYLKLKNSLK